MRTSIVLSFAFFLVSIPQASAQLVSGLGGVSVSTDSNTTGYTVASGDLIEGETGTLNATAPSYEGGGDLAVLTDGTFGSLGAYRDDALEGSGDVLTYSIAPGKLITSIDTYAGGDQYRGSQAFTVSYSLDGGLTYSTLGSVSYFNPLSGAGPATTNSEVSFGNFALANATNLQFSFAALSQYGSDYNRYREIDINGSAAPLPEPGTLGLLGLGVLLIGLARRGFSPAR